MRSRIEWGFVIAAASLGGASFGCSQGSAASTITGENQQQESVGQQAQAVTSTGTDPGPRGGPSAAGSFFPGLNAAEQARFLEALDTFNEVDSVSGTIEEGAGLGPTFNGDSCAMCHAQPESGGSSPGMLSPQHPRANPQVALATKDGATNSVPSFITAAGPVREARFIATSSANNAPLDGGVHALYTIKGRTDAVGCNLAQPDFATQLAAHNVIFRIPTPLFGLGLVENTPDATLQANLAANQSAKAALGIAGRLNTSGNDGTVTKFGWKAQNKSLTIFSGEAYNVEQGVTNEGFTNERSGVAGCVFNATPEDPISANDGSSDVVQFSNFMRMSAPPTPATQSASAQRGSALFDSVGCVQCHSRSLTTAKSPLTGMSNVTYHPFSDFAIHHMGSTLADGISQGAAIADEFRTAPLWGVGQRLFFLHDGRTSDLGAAIEAHASPNNQCTTVQNYEQFNANGTWFQPFTSAQVCGEANTVVNNYNALSASQQTDLLAFLRSL
ncbi:MAG TPA: di-heme oxidoredictase family protein [Polyangiaceae bacterium]|nr:di-heme oxidoredictase family protein [Polyangiaceae bacterium]